MKRVGMRELRGDLAAALRQAQAGERIIITVDGEPIAQLGPVEAPDHDVSIDDLVVRGLLVRARREDRPPPSMTMPTWTGTRLDQLVREVRGR
jgi:prevent-host-death family protein